MFLTYIRYFFIIYCCLFSCYRLCNKNIKFPLIIASLFISSGVIIPLISNSLLRIFFPITLCYAIIKLHLQINHALPIVIFSYGVSFILFYLSTILTSTAFISIYKTESNIPNIALLLTIGILQILICFFIFKLKRLRNGIIALIKNYKIKTIIPITFVFILIVGIYSDNRQQSDTFIMTTGNSFLFILSILFLFYWRHRITQTYREKLRQANEKSMLDEINEHKLTIEKLKADNKRLASIVHSDNKLVPAMLTAVTSHLENSDCLSMEELTTRGREMSEQLRCMAKDRQGILDSQHNEPTALPKSGLHTVDGMLSFMKARAEENHIAYKVTFADNIKDTALNALSEEDLLRLLGDLIDNAIIAVNHSEKEKAILIHLGILQDKFLVEISDSGIPFSIQTYQRFGNEQYTTHKDNGGSGIGLMDIWKIKKKYKASLHIYEFPEDHGNYTKKISFVFDRKNHFLLQTNRYKEITRELTRSDLYVFPYQSE